jgi:photosystem II stability/assembly factor-like uncharacterized protein
MRMTSLSIMWAATLKHVLRSTDAGGTWSDVTPPNAPASSTPSPNPDPVLFPVDDNAAWVAYGGFAGGPYVIFRTTNGGGMWLPATPALQRGGIVQLYFVDRAHGWATVSLGAAAGSEGIAILRTVDGGASWALIAQTNDPSTTQSSPSGLSFGCDKGFATFATSTVGVIPIECAGGPATLYRTTDGGFHWNVVSLSQLDARGGTASVGNSPTFLTTSDAILPASSYVGANQATWSLLVTHDAGASWRDFVVPGQGAIDFESTTSGWLLGSQIEATSDGGSTWRALSVPAPPFHASEMQLQYLGKGIATAWSSSTAFRTDDGAVTWRAITPPQLS